MPQRLYGLNIIVSYLLFFSTFQATSASARPGHNHDLPSVKIGNGRINGKYLSSFHQDAFLGIPYAIPPTPANDLRFRAPVLYNASFPETGYDALNYSKSCTQVRRGFEHQMISSLVPLLSEWRLLIINRKIVYL